jgi:hypothetical protein
MYYISNKNGIRSQSRKRNQTVIYEQQQRPETNLLGERSSLRTRNLSPCSEVKTSASKSVNNGLKFLANKLAYEWKSIFRALNNADREQAGIVTLKDFDNICV